MKNKYDAYAYSSDSFNMCLVVPISLKRQRLHPKSMILEFRFTSTCANPQLYGGCLGHHGNGLSWVLSQHGSEQRRILTFG